MVDSFVATDPGPGFAYQFVVLFVGTAAGLTDARIKINKYNNQYDRLDYINTVMASEVIGKTVQSVDPYYITPECSDTVVTPDGCPSLLELLNTMSVSDVVNQILISNNADEIIALLLSELGDFNNDFNSDFKVHA